MRQHKVVIHLEQHQLLLQARCALAERVHPTSDRRDPLAEVKVEALHKGRVDGPPPRRADVGTTTSRPVHRAVRAAASNAAWASVLCPDAVRVASSSQNAPGWPSYTL